MFMEYSVPCLSAIARAELRRTFFCRIVSYILFLKTFIEATFTIVYEYSRPYLFSLKKIRVCLQNIF